jgi:predicted transcriptional regulator
MLYSDLASNREVSKTLNISDETAHRAHKKPDSGNRLQSEWSNVAD